MTNSTVRVALSWAADQIADEMRHWPDGPSKVAMAKVRERILAPHPVHPAPTRYRREGGGGVAVTALVRTGPQYGVSEKSIQHWCAEMFRAAGCLVYSLSQARASKQSPGLPDLWVFVPRRATAFWWETKSAKGLQSEAQAAFQVACEATGVRYVMGGVDEAKAVLSELRLLA